MPEVRVDGDEIFYEADGAQGPALVFVHGFRNSGRSWELVRPLLDTARLRGWFLDLPGCGRSSVPPTWRGCTIEAYARCIVDLCAAFGLEDVVLVGHSLGGGVAMTVALEHPELLQGLVLVAPTPADGIGYLSEEQLSRLIDPTPDELEALARAAFHRPPSEAEFNELLSTVRAASPQHIEGAVRSQCELHLGDRLSEIKVPTLVIGGDRDRHVPIRHTLRTAAAIRRCSVQIYHGVGHAPFFEVRREFAALINHFVLFELRSVDWTIS